MNDSAPDQASVDGMRIVPRTEQSAEVQLGAERARIGSVGTDGPHWWWQHRDGERSSPVAASRAEAARALTEYHRLFKQSAQPTAPVRRLLFG
jgi:hypothetical protein